MRLGHLSHGFLASPAKLPTMEFFGVGFIIIAIAVYWSHLVNRIS